MASFSPHHEGLLPRLANHRKVLKRIVTTCRWMVARTAFDAVVFLLICLSVGLLGVEIAFAYDQPLVDALTEVQDFITGIFVGELTIRFIAMKRRSRFWHEYWLDIIAVISVFPILRLFRLLRFLRLLRLLRMFRLATLLTSHSKLFGALLQRRAAEYFFAFLLVMFSLTVGTLGLTHFESPEGGPRALERSFWVTVFSLISTQYEHDPPENLGAKFTILFVEFCGLTFFAVLTGTISAVMIEKLKEGHVLSRLMLEDMEAHVLVCGWNSGLEATLLQLQEQPEFRDRDFVVIAEREDLPDMLNLPNRSKVRLLREDFTRAEVLQRANVEKAAVALIVSDVAQGRTRQDADARTVLAALTIEKLNPKVHTCAELSNSINEPHLRMANVDVVIITQELSGNLLAQAAVNSGNTRVFNALLNSKQSLHPQRVLKEVVGEQFWNVLAIYRERYGVIPVAVQNSAGQVFVNPDDHLLEADDLLLCVGGGRSQTPGSAN